MLSDIYKRTSLKGTTDTEVIHHACTSAINMHVFHACVYDIYARLSAYVHVTNHI